MIEAKENRSPTEELVDKGTRDATDRKKWRDDLEVISKMRLGARKRVTSYPNAPNWCDPIIDDNINRLTSLEFQVIKQPRYYANFTPLTSMSADNKAKIEQGFDNLLNLVLDFDQCIETLLDCKNEKGMAVAKMVVNTTAYPQAFNGVPAAIPEIIYRDPFDVIVPMGTKDIKNANRIIDIYQYTPDQLMREEKRREWEKGAAKCVIQAVQSSRSTPGTRGQYGDVYGAERYVVLADATDSMETITIWETYSYDKNGNRIRMVFPVDAPNIILHQEEWTWLDGSDRQWPFDQFRFENRNGDYYDVRGAGHMLKDNQLAATQFLNIKGMHYDFHGKPYFRTTDAAAGNSGKVGFSPGSVLPLGIEPAPMPKVDPQLMVDAGLERERAERRVGAMQSSTQSEKRRGERVTATEVNRQAVNTQILSANAVQRFTRTIGRLFAMQWEYLRHFPVPLPVADANGSFEQLPVEVYDLPFSVRSSATSRNADPLMKLNSVISVAQFLANNPFVQQDVFAKYITNQIDPFLADTMVVDAQDQGAPINQQVQQLAQAVQMIGEQTESHQKVLDALDDDINEQELLQSIQTQTAAGGVTQA